MKFRSALNSFHERGGATTGTTAIAIYAAVIATAGLGATDEVVEKVTLSLVVPGVLNGRAETMVVELLEQPPKRRALHLLLVKRLDGSEARRGTRTGASLAHAAGAVASAHAARKGWSKVAT